MGFNSAWILFVLAIIFCGIGLLLVTMEAGSAAYSHWVNQKWVNWAYLAIVIAGSIFVIGLILIISAAVIGTVFGTSLIKKT